MTRQRRVARLIYAGAVSAGAAPGHLAAFRHQSSAAATANLVAATGSATGRRDLGDTTTRGAPATRDPGARTAFEAPPITSPAARHHFNPAHHPIPGRPSRSPCPQRQA